MCRTFKITQTSALKNLQRRKTWVWANFTHTSNPTELSGTHIVYTVCVRLGLIQSALNFPRSRSMKGVSNSLWTFWKSQFKSWCLQTQSCTQEKISIDFTGPWIRSLIQRDYTHTNINGHSTTSDGKKSIQEWPICDLTFRNVECWQLLLLWVHLLHTPVWGTFYTELFNMLMSSFYNTLRERSSGRQKEWVCTGRLIKASEPWGGTWISQLNYKVICRKLHDSIVP